MVFSRNRPRPNISYKITTQSFISQLNQIEYVTLLLITLKLVQDLLLINYTVGGQLC